MTPAVSPPPTRREPFPRPWTAADLGLMRRLGLFPGCGLALAGGRVTDAATGDPVVFTRAEYYALWDANVFSGQRVQLVRGVVVQESPMNPPHAKGIRLATDAVSPLAAPAATVRVADLLP